MGLLMKMDVKLLCFFVLTSALLSNNNAIAKPILLIQACCVASEKFRTICPNMDTEFLMQQIRASLAQKLDKNDQIDETVVLELVGQVIANNAPSATQTQKPYPQAEIKKTSTSPQTQEISVKKQSKIGALSAYIAKHASCLSHQLIQWIKSWWALTSLSTAHNDIRMIPEVIIDTHDYGICYPVPAQLKHVQHLIVTQQKGPACGYHSILNICALQELIKTKQSITSQKINEKVEEKKNLIQPKFITNDEIIKLIKESNLNLSDVYLMDARDANKLTFLENLHFNVHNPTQAMTAYNTMIKNIKSGIQKYAYFICNIGMHWVIAAYVNGKILYADSQNTPIKEKYITYYLLRNLSDLLNLA